MHYDCVLIQLMEVGYSFIYNQHYVPFVCLECFSSLANSHPDFTFTLGAVFHTCNPGVKLTWKALSHVDAHPGDLYVIGM